MRKQWVFFNVVGVFCLPLVLRAQASYTITTFAGNGSAGYLGDGGTAAGSQFASPFGAAFSGGSLYIADQANNRVRKIAADGSLSTVAGNGNPGYAGDSKGATSAQINFPSALALDSSGNLYIADTNNYVIRKVAGGNITTIAGVNSQGPGWGGDGGAATLATLGRPTGLAVNGAGDIFIADTSNNLVRRVSGANITTWAGNSVAGFAGDGNKATSGALNNPEGLALDAAGNLYIADTSNNVIRKVTSDGIISTVAGNRTPAFAGDGGPAIRASLNNPKGVAIDAAGNLYIADSLNSRIRVVTPDGIITTIAGTGRQGYTGDGGPAVSATLRFPSSVVLGAGGAIYVVDNQNSTIRLLTPIAVAAPAIRPGNGVYSASDFGGFTAVAPGSWIEIYGSNLAAHSRPWTGADFNGINAPTSLDGTKVTIGGQAAVIDYISDGQINAQVPPNAGTGAQQITVATAGGTSAPYAITVNPAQPGLYAPALLSVGGNQYVGAVFSDGVTYALPAGAVSGIASRPAHPGDNISIAGVGFGAVTPSAVPGQVVQQSNTLVAPFKISIGGAPATLTYWGLAPNAIGSYQFNLTVPSVPSGDAVPLTFTLDGVPGSQTLYIAIQN